MARHDLIEPIPDGARAGRRVEGGYRHMNATNGAEGEFSWEDREWMKGYVLAGRGAVGLVLDGAMDLGEPEMTPVRAEHVIAPDVARDLAYALLLYADVSERKT